MTSKTIGSKADQQAVLGVLKGVREAWEANDAEAFVADYLDDASVVQPGVYRKDRQEIQSSMAGAFAGPLKGSRVIDQPQDVRFLNEDTAIVISEGGIVLGTGDTRRLPWFCGKPPRIRVGCPDRVTVMSGLRPTCPVLLAQP